MPALFELERRTGRRGATRPFATSSSVCSREYVGRPTPLYFAANLTAKLGGAKIYLKREDLCHTGAHKVNNTLGQALLAVRMGKVADHGRNRRGSARRGDGDDGGAVSPRVRSLHGQRRRRAPIAQRLSHEAARRQSHRRRRGQPAASRTRSTRRCATGLRPSRNTYYLIGTAAGPHPYPMIVRDFQSVIGREARRQILKHEGRLPDVLVACVNGGSNAIGLFYPFIKDTDVRMIGVEAAGLGLNGPSHAATITAGSVGVLHGNRTYLLQDETRPDSRDPFDRRRTRLSRRRPGARVAEGERPRRVRRGHRRRGARRR